VETIHFMEVLARYGLDRLKAGARRSLKGLRFVPYYGCTLFRPPRLAKEKYFQGEMENIFTALGAEDYEEWFVRHLVAPRPVIQKLSKAA